MIEKINRTVQITIDVDISYDPSFFTDDFFDEFNETICNYDDDIDEHLKHIARNIVLYGKEETSYFEGYGIPKYIGISFDEPDIVDEEVYRKND